jgi:hypothetical protein
MLEDAGQHEKRNWRGIEIDFKLLMWHTVRAHREVGRRVRKPSAAAFIARHCHVHLYPCRGGGRNCCAWWLNRESRTNLSHLSGEYGWEREGARSIRTKFLVWKTRRLVGWCAFYITALSTFLGKRSRISLLLSSFTSNFHTIRLDLLFLTVTPLYSL